MEQLVDLQPGDGLGRQPLGIEATQGFQGLGEITGRNAIEV